MNFLVWWNPTTWLSDVSSSIVGSIVAGLRTFLYWVGTALFDLIIKLYNLFEALCHGRLLDSEIMSKLTTRVGLVLGLIMLFYVAVSFIQSLVNPEDLTNEKKGPVGVIKKVIIVIILLGTAPFLFDTLFQIQSAVVKNHVVSKILLPVNIKTENFGNALAAETFIAFYDVDPRMKGSDNEDVQTCQSVVWTLKDRIYKNGDFALGNDCLNEFVNLEDVDGEAYGDVEANIIKFDWLIMLGVGAFLVYFFVSYCISVGMRMFQIAILEIISPMAFISYLSSKDDSLFTRWKKTYFSTYIDVFLRIAIINFAVFLIAAIMDVDDTSFSTFWTTVQGGTRTDENLIMLAMIVALLAFAKKAPDLIKKLFPGGDSNLGLGGLHVKDIMGANVVAGAGRTAAAVGTGAAIGLIGGGINGAVGGFRKNGAKGLFHGLSGAAGGLFSGAFHGVDNGLNSKSIRQSIGSSFREQMLRNTRLRESIEDGSKFGGRMAASAQHALGLQTAGQKDKRNIEILNNYNKGVEALQTYADTGIDTVRNAKRYYEHLQASGASVADINNARTAWKNAQHQAIEDVLNGVTFSAANMAGATKIRAQLDNLNLQVSNNKNLFSNLTDMNGNSIPVHTITSGTNWDTIDSYGNYASAGATQLENSQEYAQHQADDQYAYWEARERGGRIPPGTGRKK